MLRIIRWIVNWGFRRDSYSVVDTALGAAVEAIPKTSNRSHIQAFQVDTPITVYVRADHCRVRIRLCDVSQVVLHANMYRAFGLNLVAEQDAAGVYIVAKRKPVIGTLSRADFSITAPVGSHLVFHLTPGDVVLEGIDGRLELPAVSVQQS